MIIPDRITNYHRTPAEQEELVLFATMVPTKPAQRMAQTLDTMLTNGRLHHSDTLSPFELVRVWIENGTLGDVLRHYTIGQYTRIERCWRELTRIVPCRPYLNHEGELVYTKQVNLKSVTALEGIFGIGPKTARFIVLHSVPNARCIPIDTHWIKELKMLGYPIKETQKTNSRGQTVTVTPIDDRAHAVYEEYALREVAKSGLSCAQKDLQVWRKWNGIYLRRAA